MRLNFSIKVLYFFIISLLIIGLFISVRQNPHAISTLIAAAFSLFLAIFVYIQARDNIVNKTFACCSGSLGIFYFDVFGFYIIPNITFLTYWIRFFRIGYVLFVPCFLHFALRLIRNEEKVKERILRIAYGMAIIFYVLNWFGLFEKGFVKTEWKYTLDVTVVYISFLSYIFIILTYALFEILKGYKKSDSILVRKQLQYVLLAGAVAIILGFTNAFLYFGIKVYPLGSFGSVAFSGIIAYAILKHQLMDIEVIIKRGVVYASLTASITAIYVVTVGIFHGLFGITRVGGSSLLVNGLAAMIIAVSFLPLRNRIQLIVDKLFFKEKHDYYKTLREFSDALRSIIGLDKLLNLLIATITETMHISRASLILLDRETDQFNIKSAKGLDKKIIDSVYFKKGDYLPKWLEENRKVLVLEGADLPDNLKKLGAAISVPLLVKDKLIGIFNLGSKMSEDMFTPEDLELLLSIANQAAIAIENARLYEEMLELEKGLSHADKLAALGALASSIAHEIKNPLVSIKTFTQLVPRKFGNADFRDKFNNIVPQELERLENILEEFLSFSRTAKSDFHPVKIENVIDNLLVLMQREASKKNINIIKKYDGNIPEIMSDSEQLKQVFMNLILNAIQAMPNGGTLTITTSSLAPSSPRRGEEKGEGKFVEIRFSDTGYGIPKENIGKLFKPSFTTKPGGTGLGLSISQKIIKEHDGTIEVESELNKGTAFIVRLPINPE